LHYQEAVTLKNEAISLTKDIYSNQLSESLANQKTEQTLKIKEKEIKSVKEKTKLYLVIASLSFFLMVVTFIALYILRKQSRELSEKNKLIKKSLNEKELLIKEMHHRVKNNFQLITSLLELQTEEIKGQKIIEHLEKGKSRIKSMSLIHQKLYRTKSSLIKFDDFINILVNELIFLYKFEEHLELDINVKEIYFDVDTAIPLALILNELITNALKYGFCKQRKNLLIISLTKISKDNYKLNFKDNGLGLKDNFTISELKSSGLKLVERLVKQLQGSLEITNQPGVKFEILFKDTKMRKEII
jgi:two-component sensor histidine kinase